jgi:hypothetical protein
MQHLVAIFFFRNSYCKSLITLHLQTPHSHIALWSRRSVICSLAAHQLWMNKTQCQHIFSISLQLDTRLRWVIRFVLPWVQLCASFIQKRVTGFKKVLYSFERAKSPSEDMGESRIWPGSLLPKYSNTIPLQNHYTDLESNEYHTTWKGKVRKCKQCALTSSYCTLIRTKSEFLRAVRIFFLFLAIVKKDLPLEFFV